MAVGTGAISLIEVLAEVTGEATQSLLGAIAAADSGAYDPTYYSAPATSLAEFRGYEEGGITPSINISPDSKASVSASANSFTISVSSNTTWSITDNASWVTISGASGSGNDGSITINVATNSTGATRSARITATTTTGSPTAQDTLIFSQLSGFE